MSSNQVSPSISVVSPVFNAAGIVPHLVERIESAIKPLRVGYEIVLVDDRSSDASWAAIVDTAHRTPCLRGVRLSRNCGQHHAITAGLAHTQGDCVVVMDCDLQDNPDYIPEMHNRFQAGYDVVLTRKIGKRYSLWRRLMSRAFHAIYARLADAEWTADIGGFSLVGRKVVDAFLRMNEYHRHYRVMLTWLGFKTSIVDVVHERRALGRSSYSLRRLMRLGVDAVVVHSEKLLYVSLAASAIFLAGAFVGGVYTVVQALRHSYMPGWPSIVVLILFTSSVVLANIGVLGIYLGRILEQVKQRPLYLVDEIISGLDDWRPADGIAAQHSPPVANSLDQVRVRTTSECSLSHGSCGNGAGRHREFPGHE
jgi:dolichol-phosphate mannosyltransferase